MHVRIPRVRVLAVALASMLPFVTPVARAAAAAPPSPAAEDPAAGSDTSDDGVARLAPVQVTSARLRDARIDLSPSVGTTVYAIDSKSFEGLSEGGGSSFDEVLLHLPGVSKDSKASGALHVRDDHGNVQYRVNGVQLPEAISGFGNSIDTRFVDHVNFLTGALPAQYGLHTAGVVEIQTQEGKLRPGGEVDLQAGSHGTFQPSVQGFGSRGDITWYVSGSELDSDQGIENPLPADSALHDRTRQQRLFTNLSWFIDDQTRAALMFGGYRGRFQIPDSPGLPAGWTLPGTSSAATGSSTLPSSALDERQAEDSRFLAASLERTLDQWNWLVSVFHQSSRLHFLPDPVGDLVYTGVSGDLLRSGSSNGLQADASWKAGSAHTLRFGGSWTAQLTAADNRLQVFQVDANGQQLPGGPILVQDASSLLGTELGSYVQDEWKLDERLTLNTGVRYDRVKAFIDEHQFSPRINAAFKWTPDTLLHAGFSRYFTPPPQELAAQRSIALFAGTSNAAASPFSDNVRAERSSYWDIGLARTLTPEFTLALDTYYKDIDNLLDEGQFGQALILSPFNYAHGTARGVELGLTYGGKAWSAYGNLAWQRARARDIVSGQALFAPDELAYIASHDVFLDHDQTWTASAGGSVHLGDWQLSGDAVFGSGLRRTDPGGAPNGDHLPGYGLLNLGLSREWKLPDGESVEGRLSLVNLFDRSYLLRDGTGVGVGAPQYGLRRSAYASASWRF